MLTLTKQEIIESCGLINFDRFNDCDARVYFLTKGSEIIYVGQTIDIASRMKSHSRYKDFDGVSYIKVPKWRVSNVEAFYIVRMQPVLNKNIPKNNMYHSSTKIKAELMEEASKKIDAMIDSKISFSNRSSKISVKYSSISSFNKVKTSFMKMMKAGER